MQNSNAAHYANSVEKFIDETDEVVMGSLSGPHGFTLTPEQLYAWRMQLPILRSALSEIDGWIHLEFDIPRLGKRVDAVLVTKSSIVPIEFKVDAKAFHPNDYEQAWDYALDLKNFHSPRR